VHQTILPGTHTSLAGVSTPHIHCSTSAVFPWLFPSRLLGESLLLLVSGSNLLVFGFHILMPLLHLITLFLEHFSVVLRNVRGGGRRHDNTETRAKKLLLHLCIVDLGTIIEFSDKLNRTSKDYIPIVKSSLKYTSLSSTAAIFLAIHLMAVLQLSRYSVFHSGVTSIQLGLP